MRRPDAFDFSDPALAFDQILVVSLARDMARYERVSRMLDGLGLTNHRRFNAFDASGAQFTCCTSTKVHILDGLGSRTTRDSTSLTRQVLTLLALLAPKCKHLMLDGLVLTNYRRFNAFDASGAVSSLLALLVQKYKY